MATAAVHRSSKTESYVDSKRKDDVRQANIVAARTGCNVLLIQKSSLRDAVTDLSLHYLSKSKILVIKEFMTKTLNCLLPIANIEHFREEKLGRADCVEEEISQGDGGKIVNITGIIKDMGRTTNVLVRGSDQLVLVLDEAERSLHNALCVIRCLVTKRFVIAGGGGAIFFH